MSYTTVYNGTRYSVQSADAGIREYDERLANEELKKDKLAAFCAGVNESFKKYEEEQRRQFAEWKRIREEKKQKLVERMKKIIKIKRLKALNRIEETNNLSSRVIGILVNFKTYIQSLNSEAVPSMC